MTGLEVSDKSLPATSYARPDENNSTAMEANDAESIDCDDLRRINAAASRFSGELVGTEAAGEGNNQRLQILEEGFPGLVHQGKQSSRGLTGLLEHKGKHSTRDINGQSERQSSILRFASDVEFERQPKPGLEHQASTISAIR